MLCDFPVASPRACCIQVLSYWSAVAKENLSKDLEVTKRSVGLLGNWTVSYIKGET